MNKPKQMNTTEKKGWRSLSSSPDFLEPGRPRPVLKRILRLNNERSDAEKLRTAVIVNDVGEINLDAD
jgi:hypothetical protein